MKKAIVTGGAGFIGSHLVDRLLKGGHDVIAIDDLSLGVMDNISLASENGQFHFVQGDCTDVQSLQRKITAIWGYNTDFSTVDFWHMAANSDISQGVNDPTVDLQKTFMTTFHSIALCQTLGIKKFLFASTSAVYGANSEGVSEDTGPLFPVSNYGAMKLASEAIISAATQTTFDSVWVFRFPNVVGTRGTHGALYDFCHKLKKTPDVLHVLGDGSQCKSYIHVSELIDAMTFTRDKSNDVINYFNVGLTGEGTTVKYMAEQTVTLSGLPARIEYGGGGIGWVGDVPRFSYDTRKINALGWTCQRTSNEAVDLSIKELVQEILGKNS